MRSIKKDTYGSEAVGVAWKEISQIQGTQESFQFGSSGVYNERGWQLIVSSGKPGALFWDVWMLWE